MKKLITFFFFIAISHIVAAQTTNYLTGNWVVRKKFGVNQSVPPLRPLDVNAAGDSLLIRNMPGSPGTLYIDASGLVYAVASTGGDSLWTYGTHPYLGGSYLYNTDILSPVSVGQFSGNKILFLRLDTSVAGQFKYVNLLTGQEDIIELLSDRVYIKNVDLNGADAQISLNGGSVSLLSDSAFNIFTSRILNLTNKFAIILQSHLACCSATHKWI